MISIPADRIAAIEARRDELQAQQRELQQTQLGMNLVAVLCQRLAKKREGKGRGATVTASPFYMSYGRARWGLTSQSWSPPGRSRSRRGAGQWSRRCAERS